ncbi:hypothetical protein C0216_22640 [Streptomyces globosus]|uniref:Uncharacterized protein n=1 Tax=Streptomyces globosus TaxID=68209 RepID=A0A344U4Q8_9ACTN|nr:MULTISPECIES: hypothetical protein [Streptomyces]AXE25879.1 hypothetical protein C0216_22640 [Streptomyces globosus]
MFPSVSLAQEVGLAVLFAAALACVAGFGRILWGARLHHPEPAATAAEGLAALPAQRVAAGHPMETVELTEAEEEAFAGLVRTIALR